MSDTDRPAHLRLYSDAVTALPLPGERMTVAAYEQIRDLLWEDAKAREPKNGEAEGKDEKGGGEKRGTELHRGGHLADSSKAWSKTIYSPDTIAFGFGRRENW